MQQGLNSHWSNYYETGRDFQLAPFSEISKFLEYVSPDAPKTALDIGCGTGQLTRELWHRGYKTFGIDVAETAISIAKSLTIFPENQLCYKQVDIEQDNLTNLPFQPYGLITLKLVYAFIHDKPAFLGKVGQLLDKAGVFVVITPLMENTPPEKKGIASSKEDIKLLSEHFDQIAFYQDRELGHFVGSRKVWQNN